MKAGKQSSFLESGASSGNESSSSYNHHTRQSNLDLVETMSMSQNHAQALETTASTRPAGPSLHHTSSSSLSSCVVSKSGMVQGVLVKRRDVFRRQWRPRMFVLNPAKGILSYYLMDEDKLQQQQASQNVKEKGGKTGGKEPLKQSSVRCTEGTTTITPATKAEPIVEDDAVEARRAQTSALLERDMNSSPQGAPTNASDKPDFSKLVRTEMASSSLTNMSTSSVSSAMSDSASAPRPASSSVEPLQSSPLPTPPPQAQRGAIFLGRCTISKNDALTEELCKHYEKKKRHLSHPRQIRKMKKQQWRQERLLEKQRRRELQQQKQHQQQLPQQQLQKKDNEGEKDKQDIQEQKSGLGMELTFDLEQTKTQEEDDHANHDSQEDDEEEDDEDMMVPTMDGPNDSNSMATTSLAEKSSRDLATLSTTTTTTTTNSTIATAIELEMFGWAEYRYAFTVGVLNNTTATTSVSSINPSSPATSYSPLPPQTSSMRKTQKAQYQHLHHLAAKTEEDRDCWIRALTEAAFCAAASSTSLPSSSVAVEAKSTVEVATKSSATSMSSSSSSVVGGGREVMTAATASVSAASSNASGGAAKDASIAPQNSKGEMASVTGASMMDTSSSRVTKPEISEESTTLKVPIWYQDVPPEFIPLLDKNLEHLLRLGGHQSRLSVLLGKNHNKTTNQNAQDNDEKQEDEEDEENEDPYQVTTVSTKKEKSKSDNKNSSWSIFSDGTVRAKMKTVRYSTAAAYQEKKQHEGEELGDEEACIQEVSTVRSDVCLDKVHPHHVLQCLLDTNEWIPRIKPDLTESKILKVYNPHTFVMYDAVRRIWPTAARDYVLLIHWRVLPDTDGNGDERPAAAPKMIVIMGFSLPFEDLCPPREDHVRMEILMGGNILLLHPLDEDNNSEKKESATGCTFQRIVTMDLKGNLPEKVSQMVMKQQASFPLVVQEALKKHTKGGVEASTLPLTKDGNTSNRALVRDVVTKLECFRDIVSHEGQTKPDGAPLVSSGDKAAALKEGKGKVTVSSLEDPQSRVAEGREQEKPENARRRKKGEPKEERAKRSGRRHRGGAPKVSSTRQPSSQSSFLKYLVFHLGAYLPFFAGAVVWSVVVWSCCGEIWSILHHVIDGVSTSAMVKTTVSSSSFQSFQREASLQTCASTSNTKKFWVACLSWFFSLVRPTLMLFLIAAVHHFLLAHKPRKASGKWKERREDNNRKRADGQSSNISFMEQFLLVLILPSLTWFLSGFGFASGNVLREPLFVLSLLVSLRIKLLEILGEPISNPAGSSLCSSALGPVTCRCMVDVRGAMRFIANQREEQREKEIAAASAPATTDNHRTLHSQQRQPEINITHIVVKAIVKAVGEMPHFRAQRVHIPFLGINGMYPPPSSSPKSEDGMGDMDDIAVSVVLPQNSSKNTRNRSSPEVYFHGANPTVRLNRVDKMTVHGVANALSNKTRSSYNTGARTYEAKNVTRKKRWLASFLKLLKHVCGVDGLFQYLDFAEGECPITCLIVTSPNSGDRSDVDIDVAPPPRVSGAPFLSQRTEHTVPIVAVVGGVKFVKDPPTTTLPPAPQPPLPQDENESQSVASSPPLSLPRPLISISITIDNPACSVAACRKFAERVQDLIRFPEVCDAPAAS